MTPSLNACQKDAMKHLLGPENIFLTGGAGSGKSHLVRHFLRENTGGFGGFRDIPILASTGAAAILVGGRTFHSFFGLGIMEGGFEKTLDKAVRNKRLVKRIKETEAIIVDEISMIPGQALRTAEAIARHARKDSRAWGGMRIIAVGDFSQLPPVTRTGQERDWAFKDSIWEKSEFTPAILRSIVRTKDPEFLEVLNLVRHGEANDQVARFLTDRQTGSVEDFDGTLMFPHRRTTEEYNLSRLNKLPGKIHSLLTEYTGKPEHVENFRKNAPIPDVIRLKEGALVMIRQNDPDGRWVNGTIGTVEDIGNEQVQIELEDETSISLAKTTFQLLDADGERVASATNFPLSLAYATTIHKAQGSTLSRMWVDLRNLWEPGHAYVALSRVRDRKSLFIAGWDRRSIMVDPEVVRFHNEIGA